jgi:hypothetical protein
VTGTAFFMWKLELFYTRLERKTRSLQNNETARQKEYGWRTVNDSLHPVYFEGNMSAEFLRDLVCSCKGKAQCKKSRVCAEKKQVLLEVC